jgi:hypothetical protein
MLNLVEENEQSTMRQTLRADFAEAVTSAAKPTISMLAAKRAAKAEQPVALPSDTQPLSRADMRPFHGQRAPPPLDLYPRALPPGGTLALAPRVEAVDGIGSRSTSYDHPTVSDSYPDRPASVLRPVVVTASVDRYPLGVTALPTRRIGLLGGRVVAKIVSRICILTGAVITPQPEDLLGKDVPRVRLAQAHHDRDGQHQHGQ